MLVLTRRIGEEIVIDEKIRVILVDVRGDRIRLGISAPASVRVDRQEVHKRRAMEPCPAISD
jgi:carbon storage regulator